MPIQFNYRNKTAQTNLIISQTPIIVTLINRLKSTWTKMKKFTWQSIHLEILRQTELSTFKTKKKPLKMSCKLKSIESKKSSSKNKRKKFKLLKMYFKLRLIELRCRHCKKRVNTGFMMMSNHHYLKKNLKLKLKKKLCKKENGLVIIFLANAYQ